MFDAFAFALGMVALINPCGFALLPAYLGLFLGLNDDPGQSRLVSLNRAQVVGVSLSAGFLAVFGLLGVAFAGVYDAIAGVVPYLTVVIGAGLVVLGAAMLGGFQLSLAIPKLNKGGTSGSVTSMFLFGVSYAVASLSCTIGLFLGVVGTSSVASDRGFADRLGSFISYGAGMALLALTLTLALAFAKTGFISKFRELLGVINTISGAILVLVGIYVALYGIWSVQVLDDPTGAWPWLDEFILGAEGVQADIAGFISERSGVLGWSFLALNLGIAGAGVVARGQSKRALSA